MVSIKEKKGQGLLKSLMIGNQIAVPHLILLSSNYYLNDLKCSSLQRTRVIKCHLDHDISPLIYSPTEHVLASVTFQKSFVTSV